MTKALIVANWKMSLNPHQASLYAHELESRIPAHRSVEVVLCPSTLSLQTLSIQVNHRQFKLGAQNCYWRDEGAFTGEVSAMMLRGVVQYVIIGHSERRHIFGESNTDIRMKMQAAIRNGLRPVLCIGETAQERADKETADTLHDQLTAGLANLTADEMDQVAIAYEPVWAISNGTDFAHHATPTAGDIGRVKRVIRRHVETMFGAEAAAAVRILYGGSVNHLNADQFLSIDGIDGLLVGGASLHLEQFVSIVESAYNQQSKRGEP